MTGLEALNKIQHDFGQLKGQELVNCYEVIYKSLNALDIINEKNVDIKLLKLSTNLLDYYTMVKSKTGENTELTEEEFELLRSVLE